MAYARLARQQRAAAGEAAKGFITAEVKLILFILNFLHLQYT